MGFVVLIVLALLGTGSTPSRPELPVFVVAWECSGEVSSGQEWSGAKIEVRDDRVRFVEVVIRFEAAELPVSEATWFESPTVAPVANFSVWEQFCRDECRDEIVDALFTEGSNPLVGRAAGGRSCRERVQVDLEGVRTSGVAIERVAMSFRAGRSGLIVTPRPESGGVVCEDERHAGRTAETSVWVDERYDLERGALLQRNASDVATYESTAPVREAAGEVLDGLVEWLAGRRPEPGSLMTGPASVRLAAYETRDLFSLCSPVGNDSDDYPDGFPGEFAFAATVLPGNDVEVMAAIEPRYASPQNDWDDEVAIRLLGDTAAPRQRDAILEILRTSVAGNDTVSASLALRALLKADPAEARRKAASLLEDPDLWRSACGVYVLSDPALARQLAGHAEITLAVRDEIVEYLATHAEPGTEDESASR